MSGQSCIMMELSKMRAEVFKESIAKEEVIKQIKEDILKLLEEKYSDVGVMEPVIALANTLSDILAGAMYACVAHDGDVPLVCYARYHEILAVITDMLRTSLLATTILVD